MKHPGRTPGRPQSAWTRERWRPALGLTWRQPQAASGRYGRQALAAFGAVASAREKVLDILDVIRSHTSHAPPLTNLAHDVTEKVVEVGA